MRRSSKDLRRQLVRIAGEPPRVDEVSDTMLVKDLRRDRSTPGVLLCHPDNVEAASRWLDKFGASSCVGDYHCPLDWGWVIDDGWVSAVAEKITVVAPDGGR